jgi:hypothetical protein
MGTVGLLLLIVGLIGLLAGGIWILVLAFKESLVWGLCSLFIPFVGLVFTFMHWATCKKPFGIWLAGLVVYIVGFVLMGAGGELQEN